VAVIQITKDIKTGNIKPIYFCSGEGQTIILINLAICEQMCCKNTNVILIKQYGRDSSIEDIVSSAKRFPMMADRQLIIMQKQELSKRIDKLESYAVNPIHGLVLPYKGKL
jgi:DNA polymerase-3 subunit delta